MGPRRWSRGRADVDRTLARLKPASMGPRRWSRGRGTPVLSPARRRSRFNGATAMEPWKSRPGRLVHRRRPSLQWGHGDGAVEELSSGSLAFCPSKASMGPRRWSRGRADRTRKHITDALASMGPRRWSRGRGRVRLRIVIEAAASMGPRRWSRGRGPRPGRNHLGTWCASMGPRRWSRGRGEGRCHPATQQA